MEDRPWNGGRFAVLEGVGGHGAYFLKLSGRSIALNRIPCLRSSESSEADPSIETI
ncbi:MAG TPA: hypothetical protein V6D18_06810 [Thermosynechococcaceae cyanobacterium]